MTFDPAYHQVCVLDFRYFYLARVTRWHGGNEYFDSTKLLSLNIVNKTQIELVKSPSNIYDNRNLMTFAVICCAQFTIWRVKAKHNSRKLKWLAYNHVL